MTREDKDVLLCLIRTALDYDIDLRERLFREIAAIQPTDRIDLNDAIKYRECNYRRRLGL